MPETNASLLVAILSALSSTCERCLLVSLQTLAIENQLLPYFFADGKRENGTLCCGLPSGT